MQGILYQAFWSQWFNVCYHRASNRFIAVNEGGQVAACTPGSFTSWTNIGSIPSHWTPWADRSGGLASDNGAASQQNSTIKIGSGSVQNINGPTTLTINSSQLISNGSGGFSVDIEPDNVRLISRAFNYREIML